MTVPDILTNIFFQSELSLNSTNPRFAIQISYNDSEIISIDTVRGFHYDPTKSDPFSAFRLIRKPVNGLRHRHCCFCIDTAGCQGQWTGTLAVDIWRCLLTPCYPFLIRFIFFVFWCCWWCN